MLLVDFFSAFFGFGLEVALNIGKRWAVHAKCLWNVLDEPVFLAFSSFLSRAYGLIVSKIWIINKKAQDE